MGAVQVLRLAVASAAIAAGAGAAHAQSRAETPVERPTVAILDLRPDADDAARADLLAALRDAEVTPIGGPLAAALLGHDPDEAAAIAALAEASDGFGQLDCGRARPSAEHAVLLLSARVADAFDEHARLAKAWTYVALCAERDGNRPAADFAVERLRGLGFGEAVPGPLPADAWARHPEIDASMGRDIVELTVPGDPGQAVWIDGRPIGAAPVTVFVAAGKHVVALADGKGRGAVMVTAFGQPLTVAVDAEDWRGDEASIVAARSWQAAGAVEADSLGALMIRIHAELAVVIGPDGRATLWEAPVRAMAAQVIAAGAARAIAAAAQEAWATAHDRAPEAGVALLHEGDVPDAREAEKDGEKAPARWWVYAAIGGAIAVGAVVIYAADAGSDHQRFELRF